VRVRQSICELEEEGEGVSRERAHERQRLVRPRCENRSQLFVRGLVKYTT
jgi:hypothetical protein